MFIRILFFISALFWSVISFAENLGITYDSFFTKFTAQVEPFQNEVGIKLPKKSDVIQSMNEKNQMKIYQIDLHSTLSIIVETDTNNNITSILSLLAVDPSDEMNQYRAMGMYGVLMGIFNPELGDKRGSVLVELFQEAANTSQASERIKGNIKYMLIPGELLTFTVSHK